MKQYQKTMEKIHVPQEQLELALDNIYSGEASEKVIEIRRKKPFRFKAIGTVAAVLAVAILVSVFALNGGTSTGGFTIIANAAEIKSDDFVNVGRLDSWGSEFGIEWEDDGEVISVSCDRQFEFHLSCKGEGLEKLTYTLSDGACFGLSPNAEGILDPTELADQTSVGYLDDRRWMLSSCTVAAGTEIISDLTLMVKEKGGPICDRMTQIGVDKVDDIFDSNTTEDICYELFNNYNHATLTITAYYEDGREEQHTVLFEFEKETVMKQNYDESEPSEHTVVVVNAKLEK